MALAVCLLFDTRTELAMRRLWTRVEELGVPTLMTHTHGQHHPHLSYAVLRRWKLAEVQEAVTALPDAGPIQLHLDGVGLFRRGRCWLIPAVTSGLATRQERVVAAVESTGAELHRHYRPGLWVPHCTLAPRVPLAAMRDVVAVVYDVLPMRAQVDRAALIDSATGQVWPLPHVP